MRGRNTTLRYLAVARKLSGAVAQGRFIGGCHLVGPEAGASCIWPIAHAHCASASTFDVYTRLPTHQSGIKNCASNFSAGQSPPEFTPRASETALGPHLHRLVVIALGFFFFLFMFAQHEATSRIRGQGPLHGITRALFGVQCCRRNPAQPSLLRKIGGKVGMKRQAVVDHSTGWISSSPSVPTLTLSSPTTSCSSPNPRHG